MEHLILELLRMEQLQLPETRDLGVLELVVEEVDLQFKIQGNQLERMVN